MKKCIRLMTLGVVTLCGLGPYSLAQYCDFPPEALTHGERREYRGFYENKAYGYSILIPTGSVGYDAVNPLYQHGFGLILGSREQSYIFVNGEPNTLEFRRPNDAASDLLRHLSEKGNKVLSSKIRRTNLGTLRAASIEVKYACPAAAGQYVITSVIATDPKGDMLYELTFYAHAERLERDRSTFNALVKSWRYLGPHF